jgi:hypothetical protein
MLQHMKKANVWFATGEEIADWCLNELFAAEHKNVAGASGR